MIEDRDVKILYSETLDGICIQRCFGLDGRVELPEKIDDKPVTALAAYAFSASMAPRLKAQGGFRGPLKLWDSQEERWEPVRPEEAEPDQYRDLPALMGDQVIGLDLPGTLDRIGAYCFYGCQNLQSLGFSTRMKDWGAGVFTGCTGLKNLKVEIALGERSCLKEVLAELRQMLVLDLQAEGRRRAKLVFPEFYEDSVENTPARIIMREMHGCGHMYRYCFSQNTDFSFREYDSLFPYMKAQEDAETGAAMALYRLYWPWDLGEKEEQIYWEYVDSHPVASLKAALKEEDTALAAWLASRCSRKSMDQLLDYLGGENQPQVLAVFMEEADRRFSRSRASGRKFQL